MLNVWASWCLPCKEEHPYLVGLKRSGLKTPIVGFLYKDTVGAGRQVLEDTGNPYDVVIFEEKNKVGIDLGVTGVPGNLHHRQEGRHSRQGELSDSG